LKRFPDIDSRPAKLRKAVSASLRAAWQLDEGLCDFSGAFASAPIGVMINPSPRPIPIPTASARLMGRPAANGVESARAPCLLQVSVELLTSNREHRKSSAVDVLNGWPLMSPKCPIWSPILSTSADTFHVSGPPHAHPPVGTLLGTGTQPFGRHRLHAVRFSTPVSRHAQRTRPAVESRLSG